MSGLHIFTADINYTFRHKRKVYAWINSAIKEYRKKSGDINIILCSDQYLHEINLNYLQHDDLTDIITFDNCEGNIVNGELYISLDRVRENATSFGSGLSNELHRVIIHGVLHLLGHKDKSKSDQAKMRLEEDRLLHLRAF